MLKKGMLRIDDDTKSFEQLSTEVIENEPDVEQDNREKDSLFQ